MYNTCTYMYMYHNYIHELNIKSLFIDIVSTINNQDKGQCPSDNQPIGQAALIPIYSMAIVLQT